MTLEEERKALEEQRRTLERERREFTRRVEIEDRRLEQQQKLFILKSFCCCSRPPSGTAAEAFQYEI